MVEIVEIKNNKFHLLPEKAIWWKEKNTLLISDVHLGKISHFRKEGIAIPTGAINENFIRLDHLIEKFNCERITQNDVNICSGCFNKFKLISEDWNWCPKHKDTERQFECTKQISSEIVINSMKKLLTYTEN